MNTSVRVVLIFGFGVALVTSFGGCDRNPSSPSATSATTAVPTAGKCEHGVEKTLCARCNPKLQAVFKAKGDWCSEHERPESQCVICNPELAKVGIK